MTLVKLDHYYPDYKQAASNYDVTNTIIIATSNLGSDLIMRNLQSEAKRWDDILKRQLMDFLRQPGCYPAVSTYTT